MYTLTDLRYQSKRRSPEELLQQLQSFSLELKLSVGIWYFAPGGGRFHERYTPELSIPERLELAAEMAKYGVQGIEAHFPSEVNEENLHLYKKLEQEAGVRLVGLGPNSFWLKESEFGSLSNPERKIREAAQKAVIGALKMVKEAGATHMGLWAGIDGFTYPLGTVFYEMWDWFEGALAECLDEVPGVRIGLETKPYEPIPNNIYRTTGDGLIMAKDVEARLKNPTNRELLEQGHCLVGFQPEIGHILMGYEVLPYAYLRITREARLQHVHVNSQPLGNYDQDLNVGVVSWQDTEALLYALKMVGYNGYFGIDINPERLPVLEAVKINARALQIMNERIDSLPHERILDCFYHPEKNRGSLEMILAESYARTAH
ncbi:MAG: xylose isomerase [Spirochaetes bacterium RBG_16_67_19]|nr:MAG: xylose isomerase [Spirochaetes bacterium RBG_16_67_19]